MSDTETRPPTPERQPKTRAPASYAAYGTDHLVLDGVTYSLAQMPEQRVMELALRGVAADLRHHAEPAKRFAELMDSTVPLGRVKGEKPLDELERAYADCLLAKLNPRKGPPVITEAEAAEKARALGKDERKALRRDPAILSAMQKRAGDAGPSPLEQAIAALKPSEAA